MSKRDVLITEKEYRNVATVKEQTRCIKNATGKNTLRGFTNEIVCYLGAVIYTDYVK